MKVYVSKHSPSLTIKLPSGARISAVKYRIEVPDELEDEFAAAVESTQDLRNSLVPCAVPEEAKKKEDAKLTANPEQLIAVLEVLDASADPSISAIPQSAEVTDIGDINPKKPADKSSVKTVDVNAALTALTGNSKGK